MRLLIELEFPDVMLFEAGSLAQASELLALNRDVCLLLLDLNLPDASGLQALWGLRESNASIPCVVLSADESPATVSAALDAGAAGFIPKTAQSREMLGGLRSVLEGGVHFPVRVTRGMALPPPEAGLVETGSPMSLSSRQMDVLRMVIEGKSNKQICRELNLSESTVKTHMETIFRRLAVNSRTQAVVAATRLGLRLSQES